MAPSEILDVVDSDDVVIGSAERSEVYARGLSHRIVHVMVRDSRGRMLLQLRSAQSSYLPLHWSTSVGGHVDSGESYEEAAQREMMEEIGVAAELAYVGKAIFHPGDGVGPKHLTVYEAVVDEGFDLGEAEVAEVRFLDTDELRDILRHGRVHPELVFVLERFYAL